MCIRDSAKSFEYAISRMNGRKELIGLDVGCADGYVTELRFKPEYGFKKVIGIDYNQTLIDRVNAEDHGMFHYHMMNIESRSFDDDMQDLMEEEDVDAFDVIFCALTLQMCIRDRWTSSPPTPASWEWKCAPPRRAT